MNMMIFDGIEWESFVVEGGGRLSLVCLWLD